MAVIDQVRLVICRRSNTAEELTCCWRFFLPASVLQTKSWETPVLYIWYHEARVCNSRNNKIWWTDRHCYFSGNCWGRPNDFKYTWQPWSTWLNISLMAVLFGSVRCQDYDCSTSLSWNMCLKCTIPFCFLQGFNWSWLHRISRSSWSWFASPWSWKLPRTEAGCFPF